MRRILTTLGVVALLGACGSGDSLSDTLTGSAWTTHEGYYQIYRDDGTYAVANTLAGARGEEASPDIEWGTWSLDEDVIALVPEDDSEYCAGVTGTYRLAVSDDEQQIDVAVESDECDARRLGFPPVLTRFDS